MEMERKMKLFEPWFSLTHLKIKTIEGRLHARNIPIAEGDVIIFTNKQLGFERNIRVKITKIKIYESFYDYLSSNSLKKCLPNFDNISDALKYYDKVYSKQELEQFYVKAIEYDFL